MDEEHDRVEELEQLLRDERALRTRAESRAAEQTEKASIWRTRAEERAERIQRLIAEPKRRKGRRTRSDQPAQPPVSTPVTAATAKPAASRLAGVMVAAAVEEQNVQVLTPFALERRLDAPSSLAEADLVIVDGANLKQLEARGTGPFADWLRLEGRQPFVFLADAATDPNHAWAAKADLVVGTDIDRFASTGVPTMRLVPSFDPATENPIGWTPSQLDAVVTSSDRDGARVLLDRDDAIIGIEVSSLSLPPAWLVNAAARGVPVTTATLGNSSSLELGQASTAAHRWAYRNHTVTMRAAEIAQHAGLDIRNPQPHVAAILVTMRPDQAAVALDMLGRQTYRPLSVLVGLHGVQPTPDLAKSIDRVAEVLPTMVLEFARQLSLGECLNRSIDASGAEVLAKIDDDDFYGPAHIEDGVHAIEYSGAGIVGKGAQFTYIESEDRTVLRRQREQQTPLGGSPTGATMLFQRHVWEQIGFPHRPRQVDVLFTRAARRNGSQVYAGSPWEFCYVRSATAHTWTAAPETFLAGATELWNGFRPERMVAPDLVAEIAAS